MPVSGPPCTRVPILLRAAISKPGVLMSLLMTLIILADCSSRDFVLLADSYGLLNGIQGQRVTEIQVSREQLQLRPHQWDPGAESHRDTGEQGTATATASSMGSRGRESPRYR